MTRPEGHGHTYRGEVTVDPETGTVMDPVELDRIPKEEVTTPLDPTNQSLLKRFRRGNAHLTTGELTMRVRERVGPPAEADVT